MIGLVILVSAAILQGCSPNYAAFTCARLFVGIGIEFTATPSPVLISELAYPTHRGKITSLYQTFFYVGAIASSWTTFGTFNITGSSWSWRIPSLLQAFFPIIQIMGLWFVPESPRWLIARGRTAEARAIFAKYHAAGNDDERLVDYEMSEITTHIEAENAATGMTFRSVSSLWPALREAACC